MDERHTDGDLLSIGVRARQLLDHVEWLTSTAPSREEAFDLIFGSDGVYIRLFPTLDDRLALRELPERRQVFALLCSLPASNG